MKFSSAIALTILAASANGYELLKDYAKGFRIGCATNTIHYNKPEYISAMKAFNYMVAENGCKFVSIQGTKGKFSFNDCDNHLKKAAELGMAFRGHALIWHAMAPKWLENEDSNTMKQSIINHITTVLKHYEGKIDTWDVVNEAIDDGSNGHGWKMRNSFLYQKVPNFIDIAFQTARQVSPKTKLFYNDYNTEGIWAKSESVYQFVADLKKRNIPIDGVGIQYHVGIKVQPKFESINDLIGRYCKLGVEVHITELDVSCDDNCYDSDGGDSKQGQVYTNALKACLNNSCCTGFLVWGVGDNDSWREAKNKPLLFNTNYQPKGQYTAILNLLKNTPESVLKDRAVQAPSIDFEPAGKVVKLNDGWYTIKNPASGKYLCVKDGKGANDQNVEICSTKQKWKVTNNSDKTITLTTEFGEYNLDVAKGSDENGANIIIYKANGGSNQKFVLRESNNANAYTITTNISNGYRTLDIESEGRVDGANILQWDNEQKGNQIWNFEAASGSSGSQTEAPSQATSCWSESLGYKCCSSCNVSVQYTDNDGAWGVEKNEWCGILKNCGSSNTCVGAQGYPCCKNTCEVYSTDNDGKWSIENNDWCLIDKTKC